MRLPQRCQKCTGVCGGSSFVQCSRHRDTHFPDNLSAFQEIKKNLEAKLVHMLAIKKI